MPRNRPAPGAPVDVAESLERERTRVVLSEFRMRKVDPAVLQIGHCAGGQALYIKALQLAAANATPDDLSTLRAAADRFEPGATEPDFSGALSAFLRALVGISHNALLINLSGFLIDSHITLAEKVATRSPSAWVNVAGVLKAERSAIVEALEKNDTPAAETALLAYTQHAKDLVSRLVTDRPDEIAATS